MSTNPLFFTLQEQYGMKYYQMPKVFFTNEKYKALSNDAKILYALLLDRLQLSIRNHWVDASDSLYFVYTNQHLSEILNVSLRKISTIKKELMDAQLLKQEQKGFNAAFHLYLLKPEITVEDIYRINQAESGADTGSPQGNPAPVASQQTDKAAATPAATSVANSASLTEKPENQGLPSVAEFATLNETASNQPSASVANSASPVSQNLLPNKTDLTHTRFKDTKESKDHRVADVKPNDRFNTAFQKPPKETDSVLLEQFVAEKRLVEKYGASFIDLLVSYARKDYLLFREAVRAVEYAIKSAEKEAGRTIGIHFLADMSPYAEDLKEDYFTTLYSVLNHIRTDHTIRDPKAYFFISFKKLTLHWIQTIELAEA